MAITFAQTEVYSALLLRTLQNTHQFASPAVVNTDWEGEITGQGDTVRLLDVGDPTISTYTPDADLTVQALTDSEKTLLIDQAKSYAFAIDRVHQRQGGNRASAIFAKAIARAAYKLRDGADLYIAGIQKTDTLAGNKLGATAVSSADTAYGLIVTLSQKLDENNVPATDRFAIITPGVYAYLRKDNRFLDAAASNMPTLQTGVVGTTLGMNILMSNNCAAGAVAGKICQAGHPYATTWAEQITDFETTPMERRFADLAKGLYVYGAKVTNPEGLANADVTVS